jgi:hypothetical protein
MAAGGERTVIPQGKPGLMHMADVVEKTRMMMVEMINQRSVEENIQNSIPWAHWLGKIMCMRILFISLPKPPISDC